MEWPEELYGQGEVLVLVVMARGSFQDGDALWTICWRLLFGSAGEAGCGLTMTTLLLAARAVAGAVAQRSKSTTCWSSCASIDGENRRKEEESWQVKARELHEEVVC